MLYPLQCGHSLCAVQLECAPVEDVRIIAVLRCHRDITSEVVDQQNDRLSCSIVG